MLCRLIRRCYQAPHKRRWVARHRKCDVVPVSSLSAHVHKPHGSPIVFRNPRRECSSSLAFRAGDTMSRSSRKLRCESPGFPGFVVATHAYKRAGSKNRPAGPVEALCRYSDMAADFVKSTCPKESENSDAEIRRSLQSLRSGSGR